MLLVLTFSYECRWPPSFEVASIKPAAPPPPGKGGLIVHGGPGGADPGLATFANIDLFSLIAMAYGIQRHQLFSPEWPAQTRFDIMASVPPNTTPNQYRLMLQGLLEDRFKLMLHREQRELQVYELEVDKKGTKLTEHPFDAAAGNDGLKPPPPPSAPPLGYQGSVNVVLGRASMERLANVLSGLLGEPVTDGTGLKGNYDVKLRALVAGHSAGVAANSDPDLFEAVEEQLGLKLVRKKRITTVFIIDHLEKKRTEN
jgi:uncharacterized protein (TIGR03435 family)